MKFLFKITGLWVFTIISSCQNYTTLDVPENLFPLIIDGRLDSNWSKARWISFDNIIIDRRIRGEASPMISARFKMLWDNRNCYFIFDVIDDIRFVRHVPKSRLEAKYDLFQSPLENDCIQISFTSDYRHGNKLSSFTFLYKGDSVISNSTFLKNTKIKFTYRETRKGYFLETSIPWKEIGINPYHKSFIGMQTIVADNDNYRIEPDLPPYSDSRISWTKLEAGNYHKVSFAHLRLK